MYRILLIKRQDEFLTYFTNLHNLWLVKNQRNINHTHTQNLKFVPQYDSKSNKKLLS